MNAPRSSVRTLLVVIGPGLLVAATGVGAGDLATAAFTGGRLGIAVLWAVAVGAFLKFVINEGLARWQLASGETLLDGCIRYFGPAFRWAFLAYLVIWSFLVALALISACGVTSHAIFPLVAPSVDKIIYGIAHSLVALVLVELGGYRLFERVMTACIGVMFVVVVTTAVALKPDIGEVCTGLFVPQIPQFRDAGLGWTVALLGGVGGTLTVLCYGYWIQEENRTSPGDLKLCRYDLACGYFMTALFGMAMLVIGSRVGALEGGGATLLAHLADVLQGSFGSVTGAVVRWSFLIGAWGAVFSSLLGVWQSVPYLFADACSPPASVGTATVVDTKSPTYRIYLYALATVPCIGLFVVKFQTAQKTYAVVGALVIPFLAAVLLILNNRRQLPESMRNRNTTNVVLVLCIIAFLLASSLEIGKVLFPAG